MNPCFYCGIAMTANEGGVGSKLRPTDKSMDHVIPRWLLKRMDQLSQERFRLNLVAACRACNEYKHNLSPLDWLVIMPSNEGATRLGELLMRMGCTINEVSDAMGRRAK